MKEDITTEFSEPVTNTTFEARTWTANHIPPTFTLKSKHESSGCPRRTFCALLKQRALFVGELKAGPRIATNVVHKQMNNKDALSNCQTIRNAASLWFRSAANCFPGPIIMFMQTSRNFAHTGLSFINQATEKSRQNEFRHVSEFCSAWFPTAERDGSTPAELQQYVRRRVLERAQTRQRKNCRLLWLLTCCEHWSVPFFSRPSNALLGPFDLTWHG